MLFDPTNDRTPPTWKLMLVHWLGLFPVIIVVSQLVGMLPASMFLIPKLAMETAIIVPLLHYVMDPLMNRLFESWLWKGVPAEPAYGPARDLVKSEKR